MVSEELSVVVSEDSTYASSLDLFDELQPAKTNNEAAKHNNFLNDFIIFPFQYVNYLDYIE